VAAVPSGPNWTPPPLYQLKKIFQHIANIRRGADKSSAFPIFLFVAQPKEFFLDGLKKLEQRSRKCMDLRGNM
jgi:hypothetical protein